jgi:hypothetical protein
VSLVDVILEALVWCQDHPAGPGSRSWRAEQDALVIAQWIEQGPLGQGRLL